MLMKGRPSVSVAPFLAAAWLALPCGRCTGHLAASAASGPSLLHTAKALQKTFLSRTATGGPAESYAALDRKAKADFVKRCSIAMSMKSKDMLPVDQVDKFCSSTDRAVECKQIVAERFREVHVRRGRMSPVCEAAWEWFQGAYGQYCPGQCEKLQCKSTCLWLAEQKRLNATGPELQNASKQLKEEAKGVVELERLLDEKDLVVKDLQTRVETARSQAEKANATFAEEHGAFAEAERAALEAENRTDTLKLRLKELQSSIDVAEDEIEPMKVEAEKLATRAKHHRKAAEVLQGKLDEVEPLLRKTMLASADVAQELLGLRRETKDVLEPAVAAAAEAIKPQEAEVEELEAKVDAAKELLRGSPDEEMFKDLVRHREAVLATANEKLRKLEQKHSQAQKDVELKAKEIETLKVEEEDQLIKVMGVEEKVSKLKAERKEEVRLADNSSAASEQQTEGVKQRERLVDENKKEVAEGEPTLESHQKALKESEEELEKVRAPMKKARSLARLAGFDFEELQRDLTAAEREQKEVSDQLQALQQSLSQRNATLQQRLGNYTQDMQDLSDRRPEIVKQHGLGLLELLGY